MPIALDNNLGATDGTMSIAGSVTLTTSAAAATNTLIVIYVSFFHPSATLSGATVGGSAATQDKAVVNGSDRFTTFSFQSVAGLASSSSIVVSFGSGGGGGLLLGAASFTGVLSSGALDTTGASTGTTGTSWTSGSATNAQADSLFTGGAGNETALTGTSTATSGTEIHDRWRTGDAQGFATGYKVVSTIAADAISGTFTQSSTANTGALVIYKAAAATVAPSTQQYQSIPFMPNSVI